MNVTLDNRVALVTGAGKGIGRGCALALANAGATVIVNDIDPTTGKQTAKEIADSGGRSLFVEADVADAQSVQSMFDTVSSQFESLHVLLNNAGVNVFKGIEDTTLDDWHTVLGVDSMGIFLMIKTALPLLKRAQGASVINIASVHAQLTIPNIMAYAGAKGSVVAMGRSLAQELGPYGIRVNAISPGFIHTPMLDAWYASESDPEATKARVESYHPLGRVGTPEDIGNLVTFLASEYSAFITGANIVIDGGLTTRLMH